MITYSIKISPCAKPRMTRRDVWKPSVAAIRYIAWSKEFIIRARLEGLRDLPAVVGFEFLIPMPKSWSKIKRDQMRGQIHQQKPDLDNLIKAVKDSFTYGRHLDDSYVGTYLFAQKVWADKGGINLTEPDPRDHNPWWNQIALFITSLFSEDKG